MISYPPRYRPTSIGLSIYSPEALGMAMRAISGTPPASATYPSANLAIAYPFRLYEPVTYVKCWFYNGATQSGNWDVGLYDEAGAKLLTAGTTVQGTINILQEKAFAVTVGPGKYYCAASASSTSLTAFSVGVTASVCSALGIVQMATAFVLPTTLTIAAFAQTQLPLFGLMRRSLTAT